MDRITKRYSAFAVGAVLILSVLSYVHPWGDLRSDSPLGTAILSGSTASAEVRMVMADKCGDCHSNNTRWPLYSRVAPVLWLVEHDVQEGREHMNLSQWEHYSIESRIDLLAKIGTQLRMKKMPLKQYILLHPKAQLSEPERKLMIDWTKVERRRLLAAEERSER